MSEYIKLNNSWVEVYSVYQKINNIWTLQSNPINSLLSNNIYIYNSRAIDTSTFVISGPSSYTGKTFNLQAMYNERVSPATWSITAGSQYATINTNGKVTIVSGTNNQTIIVQAIYNSFTDTKTITISYDNQLTIECADTISGTSGNVLARYNGDVIVPVWTITSGNAYATINALGEITITASGNITVSATYNGYTTTKNITLVYDAGSTTETIIDDQGNITTETTTTVENQDGSTTTTTTTVINNEDGSSSEIITETTENEDGSSSSTSTTTSSDGSSSETTSTTSAPDENGSVTTEETTSTTNSDGSTSETTSTIVENEDGSSTSSSETINYDGNGDVTGSTTNETEVNVDGSSSSSTTNYDGNGDPTDQQNVETDTAGNVNTQDVEFNENGDATVTGYEIDTSGNESGNGETINGDGLNTEFIPFKFASQGFTLHIIFKTIAGDQPRPPIATDTEDNGSNYLYNILSAKSTAKVGTIWPGFEIRWVIAKSGNETSGYLQFCRTLSGETSTDRKTFTNDYIGNHIYDLIVTYNPSASSKFIVRNNITNANIEAVSKYIQDDLNIELMLGYAIDHLGNPIRHSNVTIYNFEVNKLDTTTSVTNPVISCDGTHVNITCATPNSFIYYKLHENDKYNLYTSPITIAADTIIDAYATYQHNISSVVMETCIYDDGTPDAPVISYDENNFVTITCPTQGASIYYRTGETGDYYLYTAPFSINATTIVEAYSELNNLSSSIVRERCKFNDGTPDEPVIYCDGQYITISAECNVVIMYSIDGINYDIYHSAIEIYDDITIYAYTEINNLQSDIVSMLCEYTDPEPEHDYSEDYLTFTALTSGTILWKAFGNLTKTISYSINNGSWVSITSSSNGVSISVSEGDNVRFKGTNNVYATSKSAYSGFDGGTATYNISGNIMSLLYGDNFVENNTLTNSSYIFCSIFKQSGVISAENLILPAVSLKEYCYRAMFSKAHSLEKAPALPATTLAKGVYWYMFEECPITEAPDLLAETLVAECYGHMFEGCSQLSYIKCLATSGFTTSSCKTDWVKNVSLSGTFIKDTNTTWSTGTSGIPTKWIVYNDEIIEDPIITCDGEYITITCENSGASIYYRFNETGSYSLYTSPIEILASTIIESYAIKGNSQSQTVIKECLYIKHIYKFADIEFAHGPLYYDSINGYTIKDSWNYTSYNSIYGKTNGSYYFNYIEMGQLFENNNFSTSDGNIENMLDPLEGFRLPSSADWADILGTSRIGATVNSSANKHYAVIELSDVNYPSGSNATGLLLFPDNETITGVSLTNIDNTTTNTGITSTQLDAYIEQGCVFLPMGGYYDGSWNSGDNYLASTEYNSTNANVISLTSSNSNISKTSAYYMIRLVRNATYAQYSTLEESNKSLNSWNI